MSELVQDIPGLKKDYSFSRVYPSLSLAARIKSQPEDFIVEENIAVEFSGEGEHCWLYIKKRGCNTDWVAQQLAKYCGVKNVAVSYAGLKDRHAVTTQWFSVQLPGLPTPEWDNFESGFSPGETVAGNDETIQVIKCFRHNKKLQRGALKSNFFTITLRELSDSSDEMFTALAQRCNDIAEHGVPNYFGSQRFGRGGNNLDQAIKMFLYPRHRIARHKRSMYLSAARSWLFNKILSQRIDRKIWDKRLPGDVFMLDGKSACFKDEAGEGELSIDARLASNEIHPTAVLWGEGEIMVRADAADLESQIIDQVPVFRDGLLSARVKSQRRACRVVPQQFQCQRKGDDFVVSFGLPPGCYATTVLGEIFSELA